MRFSRIKGDGPQNIVRLPRLGKIRLGIKATSEKSGKEYPKETSYFVCPPEVQAKFGPKPERLPVMLATENDEQNYRQYYAVYGGNQRLKCQGDGETAERRNEKGEIEKMECPTPEHCEYAKANVCRARFDLMVVLPDVSVGGVYQLSSGSINTDIDIRSGIEMARSLYGRISWVPMEIVREARKMPEPGTTKMNTHYPVKLLPIGSLEVVMSVRKDPMLIPTGETAKYLLPEPVIEGPEVDTPTELIEDDAPKEAANKTPKPEAPALTQAQNQALDMMAYLEGAESVSALENIWKSLLPKIAKLSGPERVDVQKAHDKRVTALKQNRS